MLNRPLRIRDAVRVRPIAQRATVPWPKGCPGYRLVEEPAEVGTIVALTTAADLWPDADDRDVVGDVMVAAVLWDGLASQLADDAGDGMPEVATWLIPVDALELAIGPVVDLPELDLSDDLRLHLAASRAIAATRLAIAVQLRDRAAELEAARRESNTQRAINVRVARVLRGIADDVEAVCVCGLELHAHDRPGCTSCGAPRVRASCAACDDDGCERCGGGRGEC